MAGADHGVMPAQCNDPRHLAGEDCVYFVGMNSGKNKSVHSFILRSGSLTHVTVYPACPADQIRTANALINTRRQVRIYFAEDRFRPILREQLAQLHGFGSSRWRKRTWPPASPTTISPRASENAQQFAAPSQLKVANNSPVSRKTNYRRTVLRLSDLDHPKSAVLILLI